MATTLFDRTSDRIQACIWTAQRGLGLQVNASNKNAKQLAARNHNRPARSLVGTQTLEVT